MGLSRKEKMKEKLYGSKDVIAAFTNFLVVYARFRRDNGLVDKDNNPFELCTALTDKLGRIARQIKHFERKDPKEDWPNGMTEAMTGMIIYIILVLKHYDIRIDQGMQNELRSAISQWAKKK